MAYKTKEQIKDSWNVDGVTLMTGAKWNDTMDNLLHADQSLSINPASPKYSAVGDGDSETPTNNSTIILSAMSAAVDEKKKVGFPTGVFRVVGFLNPIQNKIFYPLRTSIEGAGEDKTVLRYGHGVGDDRSFHIGPELGTQRMKRIDSDTEDYPADLQPVIPLQDQAANLNYVTCITPADAGLLAHGDLAEVGCEHGESDADDPYWKNLRMMEVKDVDTDTGIITFTEPIPFALMAGHWDGTVYPTYAPGAYTAGQKMYYEAVAGQPELFQAKDTGTAVNANPALDGIISSVTVSNGGNGYTGAVTVVAYMDGKDLGATFSVTKTGNVITAVVPTNSIPGYNSSLTFGIYHANGGETPAVLTPVISGIRFRKLSNSIGSLPKSMNFSPVCQKVVDPVRDVKISDLTIETEENVLYSINFRKAYKCILENVTFRGNVAHPLNADEGTTYLTLKNVTIKTNNSTVQGDTHSRCGNFYECTDLVLDNIHGWSGQGNEARGFFGEGFARNITVKNSRLFARNPGAPNTYCFYAETSSWKIFNNYIHDWAIPFRTNTAANFTTDDLLKSPIAEIYDCYGNEIVGMDARQFRIPGIDPKKFYNERNVYLKLNNLYNTAGIQHRSKVDFIPFKSVTFWQEFDLSNSSTARTVGPYVNSSIGLIDLREHEFVILGQKAYMSGHSGAVRASIRASCSKSGHDRYFFSSNSAQNYTVVSSTQLQNELVAGAGTGVRYFDPTVENLNVQIFQTGATGGTVLVSWDALIMEKN